MLIEIVTTPDWHTFLGWTAIYNGKINYIWGRVGLQLIIVEGRWPV